MFLQLDPKISIFLLLTNYHLSFTFPARYSCFHTFLLTLSDTKPDINMAKRHLVAPMPPAETDAASRLPDSIKRCWVWGWFPHCQHTENREEEPFLKSRQAKWWELQPDKKQWEVWRLQVSWGKFSGMREFLIPNATGFKVFQISRNCINTYGPFPWEKSQAMCAYAELITKWNI